MKNILRSLLMYTLTISMLAGFTLAYSRYIEALEYAEKVEYLKEVANLDIHKDIKHRIAIDGGEYTLTIVKNEDFVSWEERQQELKKNPEQPISEWIVNE